MQIIWYQVKTLNSPHTPNPTTVKHKRWCSDCLVCIFQRTNTMVVTGRYIIHSFIHLFNIGKEISGLGHQGKKIINESSKEIGAWRLTVRSSVWLKNYFTFIFGLQQDVKHDVVMCDAYRTHVISSSQQSPHSSDQHD